jgi:Bacterial PH domain
VPGDAGQEAGEIAVVRMTATRRQRIGVCAFTVISSVAGVALIVVAAVVWSGFDSNAGVFGVSLLLAAALCLYYVLAYTFGFTECSPHGIRTRGVFRSVSCPWGEVAKIGIGGGRAKRVVVTRRGGSRFRLVIPSDNSISRRDFASESAVVLGYWQEITGRASRDSTADGSVPGST